MVSYPVGYIMLNSACGGKPKNEVGPRLTEDDPTKDDVLPVDVRAGSKSDEPLGSVSIGS